MLSEGTGTTTRAVAFDSVTFKREPFPVVSPLAWSADARTRVTLFAMNLNFFAGEGANALSADAEDASKQRYPLEVEYAGKVPGQPWLYQVVLRLSDDMDDTLGDVLVRINLHGVASNRVRIAVGRAGGGPPDDLGSIPTPAPPVAPALIPTPTPNPYTGGASYADTIRFLEQASWGPTPSEVTRVQSIGFRAYLNEQFSAPVSGYPNLPFPLDDQNLGCPTGSAPTCVRNNYSMYPVQLRFFQNAINKSAQSDQLRQRVAFALHQIMVVSGRDISRPSWMTPYLQLLDRNAFGNFRQLLQDITLSPAMGEYLDMRRSTATTPNENFAREILQLFSIGVDELNPDGTPQRDAQGRRIPSYNQDTVNNFTRVFTGWDVNRTVSLGQGITNYRDPMIPRTGNSHDTGSKTLLNGVVTIAGQNAQTDLNVALDNIFNHPNTGPFISRQLIQHLVTSNPSAAYVGRVAAAFNNNCAGLYPDNPCTGERGDLRATVRAILLDPEARGDVKTASNYGRLREPAQLINNILRAFDAKSFDRTTNSDGFLAPNAALLEQDIFRPATVFNYYPADYEIPGVKLSGPTFGILTTSTALRRINFVNTIIYTGIARSADTVNGNAPNGTSLDLAPLEALAGDPALLVSYLDGLLLHNTMSPEMRAAIITAVASVPTTDAAHPRKRAQMAAYLVASSSQYQVQR